TGSWSGATPILYAYRWLRCDTNGNNCAPITGAISAAYLLAAADVGSTIRSQVTASNPAGRASAQSARTQVVAAQLSPPLNTAVPVVSGTTQQGQTLASSNGSWSNNPTSYSYQWLRCDTSGNNCALI